MSPFPHTAPSDPDDAAEIRRHDWTAFTELDAMRDHWTRPGWTPGRRSYHWMLTFSDDRRLHGLASTCQERLTASGIDLVRLDTLHITLGRIAFTDETTPSTVKRIANEATAGSTFSPFELAIGPLTGSTGALRFTVAPWTPLLTLHTKLAAATKHVLGDRTVMNTLGYRPHLSIGYANSTLPIGLVLAAVEELREIPPVSSMVTRASLVELRREGRAYLFDPVASVTLDRGVASWAPGRSAAPP